MNDEFLHALRREPPPRFANELKRRLERHASRRRNRFVIRTMFAAVVIGGVAMAAVLLLRDRNESARDAAPVTHVVPAPSVPRTAANTAQPPARQVGATSNRSEPQAAESASDEVPGVTFVTSSLARPVAQALVENLDVQPPLAAPSLRVLEANDAFAALCGGADVVIASRRIAELELVACRNHGIEVVEWKLGYQAVVLTAGPTAERAALSPREVYLALARRIPDPADPSRLIENPNTTWHDVDSRFDWRTIDVLAPSDALVRHVFVQLVMQAGCETYPAIRDLKHAHRARYEEACHQLRTDGHYREVPVSNTLVTQQLWAEPNWLVLLGYSYYDMYRRQLLGTMLAGAEPTPASLEDGTYSAARPVYAYVPGDRLYGNPVMRKLTFVLSGGWALGSNGYPQRSGLVQLDDARPWRPYARPPVPLTLESLSTTKEHSR
jgi:phosphate transport system substrate-binding protein